jgi:hypothetical protein
MLCQDQCPNKSVFSAVCARDCPLLLLMTPSALLEPLSPVRHLRLQVPALVRTTVVLLDASLGSDGVGEADSNDACGLGIEQDNVLDLAEFGALFASVFDDVFGQVFVFLELLQGEHVLEDDDFVPAVGSGGQDGDFVVVPFGQATRR